MSESFSREPVGAALGLSARDLGPLIARFIPECTTNGLSVIAVPVECTGHYSQTAARKAGFQERARLAYRDFRFEGRAVFAAIDPPHTHVILYEGEF